METKRIILGVMFPKFIATFNPISGQLEKTEENLGRCDVFIRIFIEFFSGKILNYDYLSITGNFDEIRKKFNKILEISKGAKFALIYKNIEYEEVRKFALLRIEDFPKEVIEAYIISNNENEQILLNDNLSEIFSNNSHKIIF